ncbi:MAG: thioredoxin-like domain-containing protein, partial [Planctomycetaceae bacterium]
MSIRLLFLFTIVALALPTSCQAQQSQAAPSDSTELVENPFPERVLAPEAILDGGKEWLNASGPIQLKDLRGKIVILDFWTYCCINCMHVLPDLKYLEQKYPNELVVIGVHSAKFDNEKDSENIRQAIMRHEIEHPVVNDADMVIWRKFGARSWPTLAIVDPEGYYCGSQPGEGNRELLDAIVGRLVKYHRQKKTLDESPIKFSLEREKTKPTPLRYPGKVLADTEGNRLFIADTGNNRIVVTDMGGTLLHVIGNGAIGLRDGSFEDAEFDHPQGMALAEEQLYVADTENHVIRAVDLTNKTVSTIAGTGKQSRRRVAGGPAKTTALNSPWALQHLDGILFIAMAGPHQIWQHVIGGDEVSVYAGSGAEDVVNGSLKQAALAQPSGLASDGNWLYVADSEGSAIRRIGTS